MPTEDAANELEFGVKRIAERYLNTTERKAHYLLSGGLVPGAFKMGNQWALLPSEYRAGILERARTGIKPARTA